MCTGHSRIADPILPGSINPLRNARTTRGNYFCRRLNAGDARARILRVARE